MTRETMAYEIAETAAMGSPTEEELLAFVAYDHAAEDLARRGLTGAIGDPLPLNMSARAVNLINADPEAFQIRVRAFAYAQAMERTHAIHGDPQDRE